VKIIIALNLVMTVLISVLLIWGAVKVSTLTLVESFIQAFDIFIMHHFMSYESMRSAIHEQ